MEREELGAQLDKIALDLSLLDMGDLRGLAMIEERLEQLAAAGTGREAALVDLLAKVATALILEENDANRDQHMVVLERGVEIVQKLIQGQELGEVEQNWRTEAAALMGEELPAAPEAAAEEPAAAEPTPIPDTPSAEAAVASLGGSSPEEELADNDGPQRDDELFQAFVTEAYEHLEAAEQGLLELRANPEDKELLNQLFRSFHTIKGAAGFVNLLNVSNLTHSAENLLDLARKDKLKLVGERLDAIFSAIDATRSLIGFAESGESGPGPDCSALVVRLEKLEHADAVQESPEAAAASGEAAVAGGGAEGGAHAAHKASSFVRVETGKLDDLVNMMGEMVIAHALVDGRARNNNKPTAEKAQSGDRAGAAKELSQMSKIIKDLQEKVMVLRMVPIKGVFERMARLVYDLSRKSGKQVELVREGEETEVDKNVVEELVDPLIHLMRNACDHGVESAEKRREAGKPPVGRVELSARHQGGNIVVELRDDGNGLPREKIIKKALERGLIESADNLTDEQIYGLIFLPGFSTADKITDISGRGVGLDVVRQNVQKLRGKVEVHSEPGKGTTFVISLPLTMAIIDGMVIQVGHERYIVPLLSIVESLCPKREDIFTVQGKGEMVKIREGLYPIVRLHHLFDLEPRTLRPWESLLLLIEGKDARFCLQVDELIGIQQIVIKGVEEKMRHKGVSGCAILGDGRVGLILDMDRVFLASHEERGWQAKPRTEEDDLQPEAQAELHSAEAA
ncbi:MAG: chemotaxis protein CheA [Candidatus Latescibacteria bacterium]|nr:chemotaxis protein CheA [Candidatus Latescibacterota bacterium]